MQTATADFLWNPHSLPFIAGPCSGESEADIMHMAQRLTELNVPIMRAGVWKPRTTASDYSGPGKPALAWLQQAKHATGIKVATEVATPEHVELALSHEIDILWIGARTTTSPIATQAIADALAGTQQTVLIKNPLNPDIKLWIGAVDRLQRAGLTQLALIHRGFSLGQLTHVRNPPLWHLAKQVRQQLPALPMLVDPSHICGNRSGITAVAEIAKNLGYDGFMVETHPQPERAKSDANQQITPKSLHQLIQHLDPIAPLQHHDNLQTLINKESINDINELIQHWQQSKKILSNLT